MLRKQFTHAKIEICIEEPVRQNKNTITALQEQVLKSTKTIIDRMWPQVRH